MSSTSPESDFIGAIEADCQTALANLKADGSQYNRRSFIKSFYAFLEGFLQCMRQHVVGSKELTTAEKAILSEESYFVNAKYQIKTRQNAFLTFDQSFHLSLRYFFGESYDSFEINFGDGGWKALVEGLSIRNRITHPKLTGQLEITDDELKTIEKAKEWVDGVIQGLASRHHSDSLRKREEMARQRAIMEEATQVAGYRGAELRRLHDSIIGHGIKHGVVYHVGFIGTEMGVEHQMQAYYLHAGVKVMVIENSDRFFKDIVFPVLFSDDYAQ